MDAEQVILVDADDRELGTMAKLAAHEQGGRLHRAFSVFVRDPQGRWLLQRRAADKYHFPNLWTNTCCSHPRPGEPTAAAAHRRLLEEMGFDCPLEERFSFVYRATSEAEGLTEHELDHVFIGRYDGECRPNPAEVAEVRWVDPGALETEIRSRPEAFTPWFRIAMERVRGFSP